MAPRNESPSSLPQPSRREFLVRGIPGAASVALLLRHSMEGTAAAEEKEVKEGADVRFTTDFPIKVFWEKGEESGTLEHPGKVPEGAVRLSVGPHHNGEYDQVVVNYRVNDKDSGPKDGKYALELKKGDTVEVLVKKIMPPAHAEFAPVKDGKKGQVLVSVMRPLAGLEKDKEGDAERWRSTSMIVMEMGLEAGADKKNVEEVMEKGIKALSRHLAQYALARVEGNTSAGRFRDKQLAVLFENRGDGKIAERQVGMSEDELAESVELGLIGIKRKTLTGGTSFSEELQNALKLLMKERGDQ